MASVGELRVVIVVLLGVVNPSSGAGELTFVVGSVGGHRGIRIELIEILLHGRLDLSQLPLIHLFHLPHQLLLNDGIVGDLVFAIHFYLWIYPLLFC